jgi:hypothetical protein
MRLWPYLLLLRAAGREFEAVPMCDDACRIPRILAVTLVMMALANADLPQEHPILMPASVEASEKRAEDPLRRPQEGTAAERRALEAAARLTRATVRYPIVLIDPELAPDPEAIRRVDAFIVTEQDGQLRQKIYVNRESALVRRAAAGDDFSVKVLAAVLVHEMAHLAGQKEPEARAAEQRFFSDLITDGVISEADGLRYLAQLRQRPLESGGPSAR